MVVQLYGYREIIGVDVDVDAALKLSEYGDETVTRLGAIRVGTWPAARPIAPRGRRAVAVASALSPNTN
ncbi:hypothetical protein [Millisia brevis]|uniref:hypothetical protein n=1 Tax=Millisia brevis TaxID=264148 RepID=UPI00082BCFA6|nr:hypothetical protein [Millisia brevis]